MGMGGASSACIEGGVMYAGCCISGVMYAGCCISGGSSTLRMGSVSIVHTSL